MLAVVAAILAFVFLRNWVAQAAIPCPHFSGIYAISGEARVVDNVLRILGGDRSDYVGGTLNITADESGRLTLLARPQIIDALKTYEMRILLSPRDYSCKGGWIVMNSLQKFSRSVEWSMYEGLITLRFKPLVTAYDDSLQLELAFKGHKTINLFSYDSASIDIGIPWSRYSETTKLEWEQTASRVTTLLSAQPPMVATPAEPPAVQQLRLSLTPAMLQGIQLNDLAPTARGVIARISARHVQELDALEKRMRTAGLVFAIEDKPVWTSQSQSYLLEVMFPIP